MRLVSKKMLGFEPSIYQKEIYKEIIKGKSNIIVNACAGSGKTTTIIGATKLISNDKDCLFIAFNKSIVEELKAKIGDRNNIKVNTLHALGYTIIFENLHRRTQVDEYKYLTELNNVVFTFIEKIDKKLKNKDILKLKKNVLELFNFSRLNLAKNIKEIKEIANFYEIEVKYNEVEIVKYLMDWGIKNLNKVDYTDMVWLPNVLNMNTKKQLYDWVFLDECQDASLASISLFKKTFKKNTRFIAIGDENQMIYNFAGSSLEAMDSMKRMPNTKFFPLPISYRCTKKIVEFASKYSPNIIAKENAKDGEVIKNVSLDNIKVDDMVLCRIKFPLFELYTKLIQKNIPCYMVGSNIGYSLIEEVNKYDDKTISYDFTKKGLLPALYKDLFEARNNIIKTNRITKVEANNSTIVLNLYDTISLVEILSSFFKLEKKSDLIKCIKNIFNEQERGVKLCTIHKSKGLENDRVFIIGDEEEEIKVKKDYEEKQEHNLRYVAYTRAKNYLGFLNINEFSSFLNYNNSFEFNSKLDRIEKHIADLYNIDIEYKNKDINLSKYNLEKSNIDLKLSKYKNIKKNKIIKKR